MVEVSSVIIRKNKVYIPVQGKTDSGLFMYTEPVFVCNVDLQEIRENLKKVESIGHPIIHIKTSADRKKYADVLPKVSGARSWKELGRTGFCYSLGWIEKNIRLKISRLDKQGRWEYDPEKTRLFPIETPIEDIIQIIIDDYHSRGQ